MKAVKEKRGLGIMKGIVDGTILGELLGDIIPTKMIGAKEDYENVFKVLCLGLFIKDIHCFVQIFVNNLSIDFNSSNRKA